MMYNIKHREMILMNDFKSIPNELKTLKQWVLWKATPIKNRIAKIPFSINGKWAKTNDSSTWSSFEEVVKSFNDGDFNGIGFVFTKDDPYCGIDIDSCLEIDGYKPMLTEEASYIVDLLQSYTEISPSGTGVHIIVKASKSTKLCRPNGIEIYEFGRYFCMTGNELFESWEVEERQEQLNQICMVNA